MYRSALDTLVHRGWTDLIIGYVATLWKKSYPFVSPEKLATKAAPVVKYHNFEDALCGVHHRDCPCSRLSSHQSAQLKNENLASSTQAVSEALHEEVSKDKQMSIGRKKFNIDPKKGIEYLIDNGLLTHTSKDVSQFLFTGEGLNKSQIGNYLGEYTDFNLKVLHDFINLQDFTNLGILQALRQFLWTFHPPGEAQKIERMLEGFSRRYCHLNPTAFQDSSGCFTLAFCIVILNTLLHNENVKEKPPLKVFVEMVNLEQDLPEAMLEDIFEAIKAEPFKKDDGDDLMHTFFNPDREGWLWKQGGRYKSWKRRWFIMTGKCLYYFEYTTDKEFRGIIPLENIKVREVDDRRMTNCFEIFSDTSSIVKACKTSNGKVVEGRHHVYRISATSKGEKQQWTNLQQVPENYLDKFTVICICGGSKEEIISLNNKCRENGSIFFTGEVYGLHGYCFSDLIDHSYVEEVKEKAETKKGEEKQVVEDTKMVKKKESFIPYSVALEVDWTSSKYAPRLKRLTPSVFILNVLQEFVFLHQRRPDPSQREADEVELLTIKNALLNKMSVPQEKLNNNFVESIFGQISPVCAIVGGVLSQEIIKAVSKKDAPLNNFFFFHPDEGAGVVEALGY